MAKPLRKTSNLLESLCKESERGEREAWREEGSRRRRERGRAGEGGGPVLDLRTEKRKGRGEERLYMV